MINQLATLPLSSAQQRILLIEQLFPNTPIHNLSGASVYEFDVDFALLKNAVNLFVKHHDAARIRFFINENNEIEQFVSDYATINIEIFDFSEKENPQRSFELWSKTESLKVFDWRESELIRFSFFRIQDNRTGYFINIHHSIADGWSIHLMANFISKAYNQLNLREEINKHKYSNYLLQEREYFHSKRFEKDKIFWTNRVRNLPVDFNPQFTSSIVGNQLVFKLEKKVIQDFRNFANRYQISLPTLITGLVALQQYNTSRNSTIGIGLPIFNHTGKYKECFGMMTSTLPLLMDLSLDLSITEFFKLLASEIRFSFLHQKFPYDLILKEYQKLKPQTTGLFDICVNYYNTKMNVSTALEGNQGVVHEQYIGYQIFPLYLVVKEWSENEEMEFAFNYKMSTYNEEEVTQIYQDILVLFEQIRHDKNRCIQHLFEKENPKVDIDRIFFKNVNFKKKEIVLNSRFPRKSEAPQGKLFNRDQLVHACKGLNENFFDKISSFYAQSIEVIFISLILDLLRRFTGDQNIGLSTLSPENKEPLLVNCLFEDEDTIDLVMKKVSYALSTNSYFSSEMKTEVLCYIGDSSILDTISREDYYNITLGLKEGNGGVILTCDFNKSLYDLRIIEKICRHFEILLTLYISNYKVLIKSCYFLPQEDEKHLLHLFNDTKAEIPVSRSIVDRFEKFALDLPNTIAIRFREEEITYAKLNLRAERLAGLLVSHGVKNNTVVPIMSERSIELIVGIFAILKAGGAYLPVDSSFPSDRVNFILQDCKAQLVLTTTKNRALFDDIYHSILLDDKSIYEEDVGYVKPIRSQDDLAYVIYTSGSTGNPKGVMISHLAALNRIEWMQRTYPIGIGDVVLQKTSISFDVSVWELFWWSMTGATCCLLEPKGEFEPDIICKSIEIHKVSVIHFVPSILSPFLDFVENSLSDQRCKTLIYVFSSGEALPSHTVNKFNNLFENTSLANLYGPTEATIDVSYHNPKKVGICEKVLIGRPIDNIQLYVLDSGLSLQPIGIPGELYIAGIGLAKGYFNNEKLTAEKFIDNPFFKGKKIYKTGDLARWLPSGELEYLGRIDHQIKFHGYRIELREIEITLRKYNSVKDAVAMVVQDNAGNEKLCAYVSPKIHDKLANLKEHLKKWLPSYMVPSRIIFLKELPLTSSGKIDRKTLKQYKGAHYNETYVAPSTPKESTMVEIWSEVLNEKDIGVEDNFFSIGGDSIKFINLLSKAKKKGFSFTYQDLFESPTIKQLLETDNIFTKIKKTVNRQPFDLISERDKLLTPDGIEDAYPLSVLQAGLIYQSEIQKGTALYFDVFSYKISGPFDSVLFERAVNDLIQQNEMIRTTYHLKGYSEYIQVVHDKIPIPLEIIDLKSLNEREQYQKIKEYVQSIRKTGINFENPGIIRFYIHILNDSEYMYTVSFHDSALDGWSVNLLHTSLFEKYYSLLNGDSNPNKGLSSKYRDFIKLEKKSIESIKASKFWNNKLNDWVFTHIPRWYERKNDTRIKVAYHEVAVSKELSLSVKELAKRTRVPIKSVLLAAHCKVLNVLSGNIDILTGYEISGRPEEEDGEKVLGLFLNTVPFRVNCESGSWNNLIKEVHASEREILPYRRYPMAHIKRKHAGAGQMFESVFNFTHFHVLKKLRELDGFDLIDVRMEAETEFILRAEFSLHPFTDDLLFWLHYHSNEFTLKQIESISGYYIRTLELMVENESASHECQSVLSKQEEQTQLEKFNSNKVEFPSEKTIVELIENQAKSRPDAVSVKFEKNEWTYAELNKYANRLANYLIDNGLEVEQSVVVIMGRNNFWMAAFLGILKAGGVYVPIDPDWPEKRKSAIVDKTKSGFIVVDEGNEEQIVGLYKTHEKKPKIIKINECLENCIKELNPVNRATPNNLAYIIFTSGSTGEPKGAMIEHKGMLNHLFSKINDLDIVVTDIIAQNSSQCFDISVWQLVSGLIIGAKTVIYSNELILDIDRFLNSITSDKITILELVPSYMEMVLHRVERDYISLDNIKYLLVTGEPLKSGLVASWFKYYKEVPLVNAYGPTEASDDITHHFMSKAPEDSIVPVGTPIQNLNIYVVDRFDQLVPIGTKGEVYVSGVGVGRGYIGDLEKTNTVFTSDHFNPNKNLRLYKTGDVGRWTPNGILQLFGRKDDQIKLNGYRIDLGEIEVQLQKKTNIREASVVLNPKSKELIAFVVCNELQVKDEFQMYLKGLLPTYMIPSSFVLLKNLPLSSSGKINKKELIERSDSLVKPVEVKEPLNNKEELELAIEWAKVLDIKLDLIHARSNFFELGGHSLKAMELSINMERKYSINDIMKFPILSEMAEAKKKGKTDELLINFTQADGNQEVSLIGCTYAGGSASNFLPLFNEINNLNIGIGCYAIEYPRSKKSNVRELALLCADQIKIKVDTPIAIWGHCSGSALALELTKVLEEKNIITTKLFIGGKVLKNRKNMRTYSFLTSVLSPFMAVDASKMKNKQIQKWMIDKTGFDEFSELGEEGSAAISEAFRIDSVVANEYLKEIILSRNWQINTPIVNVVANDDLLTKKHRIKYKNWKLFTKNVKLIELKTGGHYFIKSRVSKVAEIILKELKS